MKITKGLELLSLFFVKRIVKKIYRSFGFVIILNFLGLTSREKSYAHHIARASFEGGLITMCQVLFSIFTFL